MSVQSEQVWSFLDLAKVMIKSQGHKVKINATIQISNGKHSQFATYEGQFQIRMSINKQQ